MPLRTDALSPVVSKIGDANYWGITELRIELPLSSNPRAVVTFFARQIDADETTQLWASPPQAVVFEGHRMTEIMGDALQRAKDAARANPEQALYIGIRDALYAALQQDGLIPDTAK